MRYLLLFLLFLGMSYGGYLPPSEIPEGFDLNTYGIPLKYRGVWRVEKSTNLITGVQDGVSYPFLRVGAGSVTYPPKYYPDMISGYTRNTDRRARGKFTFSNGATYHSVIMRLPSSDPLGRLNYGRLYLELVLITPRVGYMIWYSANLIPTRITMCLIN